MESQHSWGARRGDMVTLRRGAAGRNHGIGLRSLNNSNDEPLSGCFPPEECCPKHDVRCAKAGNGIRGTTIQAARKSLITSAPTKSGMAHRLLFSCNEPDGYATGLPSFFGDEWISDSDRRSIQPRAPLRRVPI